MAAIQEMRSINDEQHKQLSRKKSRPSAPDTIKKSVRGVGGFVADAITPMDSDNL
jgi:hypothetical protein